ncbi:MAG: hypothetical protein L0Z50_33025 [Verrucomicrobiales bacterium]|nr:hypothetical protein [Verrucomicrobiales bacterium]
MKELPSVEASSQPAPQVRSVPMWKPVLFAAMAGGMGWGIRGQYGHETGAMIAGLLVALVLTLLFCPRDDAWSVARAVAWCTVATGFGGSMTYGQTVGLTHDAPLVGNWGALRWGLLGLAIKGGLWIGFAGVFLGMGLSGVRYRVRELFIAWLGVLGLCALGIWLLNEPFDPTKQILPRIYFSDDWRWEPGAALKPRREIWGGLLFALAGLLAYAGRWRGDRLAWRLGLWGVLGGAVGFPLGQCLQAYHAWNLDYFRQGGWAQIDPLINWWNFMETTFGAVMGAALGLGLWVNRRCVGIPRNADRFTIPVWVGWILAAVHCALLIGTEFLALSWVDALYDFGLMLGFIPIVALAGGRWWPWLVLLPMTALPIAGKTLRELAYRQQVIAPWLGWIIYVVLPLGLLAVAAAGFARRAERSAQAQSILRPALLLTTWLYFGLNFAFFQFPWPWAKWTARTPNAIIYTVCALSLSFLAVRDCCGRREVGHP